MLFLRPDVVVMFDRTESLDPAHEKRFLLHGTQAPTVDGQTYTITNGPGRCS